MENIETLEEFVQQTQRKIDRLNDFIALSLRQKNITKELRQIIDKAANIKDTLILAHQSMQEEMKKVQEDCENVMSEMRKKQIVIMDYVIKEKQRKLKEAEEEQKKVQLLLSCGKSVKSVVGGSAVKSSAVKRLGTDMASLNLNHVGGITPRLKISDYKNSPLVKKKIAPIPILFAEFDVHITQQQFDKIPKYMCGRETVDQLNGFLESVIIPCFNEKYQLIHKQRNILRSNDLELWKMYNEQASYLPGKYFITPGDIGRHQNKMLDKKTQNRLTMLRHIGILQEQRVKQTVCYVWSHNG
uniref:SKA complex subunit 1 n=1 Tax=Musca domestica TaxID=7370 RepID=A0A1I8MGB2_MUSDO